MLMTHKNIVVRGGKNMAADIKEELTQHGLDIVAFLKSWAIFIPIGVAIAIWAILQIPQVGGAIGQFIGNLINALP